MKAAHEELNPAKITEKLILQTLSNRNYDAKKKKVLEQICELWN